MLCQDCKKISTCTKLCERAEKWVNQDYRSQFEKTFSPVPSRELGEIRKELTLDMINYHSGIIPLSEVQGYFKETAVNFPYLTPLQNKILHYKVFEGLRYAQIAQRVRKSKTVVRGQITRAYAKIRAKESEKKREK